MYAMKTYGKRIKLFGLGVASLCLALLAAGCSKSYPGVEYDEPDDMMLSSQERFDSIPILLTFNAPELSFVTRGVGPIDRDFPDWAKSKTRFYIFAFQAPNHAFTDGNSISYKETMSSNNPDKNACLVDGTGENTVGHGKAARFSTTGNNTEFDGNLSWVGDPCFYNQTHQDYKYNFFAYSIDDAVLNGTVKRDKDSVYMDLTLDGTQDIISGIARPSSWESVLDRYKDPNTGIYYSEVQDIVRNGVDNYTYSTMLGHRNIHPDFQMKHELVRFQFNLKKGDEAAENIYVEDIILSATHQARFTVAHKDTTRIGLVAKGDTVEHHLPELIPATADSDPYYTPTMGEGAAGFENQYSFGLTDAEKMSIGADIMLPPQHYYKLKLKCKQVLVLQDGTTKEYFFSPVYRLASPVEGKTFTAGSQYVVNITVYGLQEIRLNASGMSWTKVEEEVDIDEEETKIENDI